MLALVESEEHAHTDKRKARRIVPLEALTQIRDREERKHGKRDHFLYRL